MYKGYPVSWQDELRQLDEELAAGRLSAEDYRRQRDDLLSKSASTAAPLKSAQQPAQDPAPQQQAGSPFPPPFRWDPTPEDATQKITPTRRDAGAEPAAPAEDDAERTQVVHRPQPRPAAEHTETVTGQQPSFQPRFPPRPGQPAPSVQPEQPPQPELQAGAPWQQSDDQAPPWGGWDLPQQDQTPAWLRQGPEEFESTKGSSATGKIVITVAAVLVVAALAVGAFFIFRRDGNNVARQDSTATATAASSTVPQTPTTTTAASAASATATTPAGPPIADLPGLVSDTSKVTMFADMAKIDYLTSQETDIYRNGGAAATRLAISKDGDARIIILITTQRDVVSAATTRDSLGNLQLTYGLMALPAAPGVRAGANDVAPDGPLRRAHYAADKYVVRVQVQGTDQAHVNQLFSEVLGAQLDQIPANA